MTAKVQTHLFDYKLTVKSPLGGFLDITNVITEINMYEDMFGPFMRIEIVLADALGIIDKLPILGDEEIRFQYEIEGKIAFLQDFMLYKVSDRNIIKARTHSAILHGISKAGLNDSLQSVYKPYIEEKPHKIIIDLFDNYLNKDLGLDAKILFNNKIGSFTKNKVSIIGSGQNPTHLINFLKAESQSSRSDDYKNPSNFVFFETRDYFRLENLSSYFEDEVKKEFFLNVPQETDKFEKGENTFPSESIYSINFVDLLDRIDEVHRGAYLNEINIIDPILKRFKMHPIKEKDRFQFKYVRDFDDKLKHLTNSGFKYITDQGEVGKGEKPYAPHRRMLMTQIDDIDYLGEGKEYPEIGYLEGRLFPGDVLNAPRKRHKNLNLSLHELNNLSSQVVEITIPGDPDLQIGDLINIQLPQPTQIKTESQTFLMLYGQKATFIITAIRHMYQLENDGYFMILSCSKESFGEEPKSEVI